MMKEIIEGIANNFREKVRKDYRSNEITEEHLQEMMIFIDEIKNEGDDLSVIKMLHVAKTTYIIMK